jgi:flagellar M-ring protein FliF
MAHQALGLLPARGDQLSVFALPETARRQAELPAAVPAAQPPARIPQVRPVSPPAAAVHPFVLPEWSLSAAAAVLVMLGAIGWLRARRAPATATATATEAQAGDLDAELDVLRSQVLADPRVAADVIKLWMRT